MPRQVNLILILNLIPNQNQMMKMFKSKVTTSILTQKVQLVLMLNMTEKKESQQNTLMTFS